MPNPVENRSADAPQQPQQPVNPSPVPGGVGSAQTSVQSAKGQEYEPGWIETGINKIREWVVWALEKLFPSWFRKPPPPAVPPMPEPPPPIPSLQLSSEIQAQVTLLDHLNRLTDLQKERIYRRVGIDASQSWYRYPGQWLRSYEEIGENIIIENPGILISGGYIVLPQAKR